MINNLIRFMNGLIGKLIPDSLYLKIKFRYNIGNNLNLKNPKTFNEKLQWLKLYDHNPKYIDLVDKFAVRKYVSEIIGEKYLIPLLGVYDNVEEINWEELPNQFVLKCTHGSGCNIICTNKKNLDIAKANLKMNKWLKMNWYWYGREWPYKYIKPRIICEKYMVDESGTELKDYKLMCFNGKVKCSFVCLNRNTSSGLNVDFYDMDWKNMPFQRRYPNSGTIIHRPKEFNKMVDYAEKFSTDIPFLRVDFYETNGQLFFGELTFYPGSGFEEFTPESYDYLLGSWIDLPIDVNN